MGGRSWMGSGSIVAVVGSSNDHGGYTLDHKRYAVLCAALAGFLLISTPMVSASRYREDGAMTSVDTDFSSDAAIADATRFRQQLAFDATPATVSRAATDRAAYPDLTFGVPLSRPEADEVLRRDQIALDIAPVIETVAKEPGWAGAWLDHTASGQPVFQFTGDATMRMPELAPLMPADVPSYRVVTVAHSLVDLDAQRDTVWAAADSLAGQGIEITGIGIDTIGNRLRIGLLEPTDAASATLRSMFGADIEIHQEDYGAADSCPATGCMPIKAGIGVTDTNGNYPCTIGYLAKRTDTNPDQLVAITAGHCVKLASKAHYWKHGSVYIGLPSKKSGVYVQGYWNGSTADVGSFTTKQLSAANRRTRNLLLTSVSGGTADITGYISWTSQVVNTVVCRTGRTTDIKCGTIVDRDEDKYSNVYHTDGSLWYHYKINHSVVYSIDGLGGDSGAPVYTLTSPPFSTRNVATMYGTHFDSPYGSTFHSDWNGWYSAIDRGIARLETSFPGFNISLCTTATCGLPDPIGD